MTLAVIAGPMLVVLAVLGVVAAVGAVVRILFLWHAWLHERESRHEPPRRRP